MSHCPTGLTNFDCTADNKSRVSDSRDFSSPFLEPNFGPSPNAKLPNIYPPKNGQKKTQKKNQGVFVKHYSMPPVATKSKKLFLASR